MRDLWGVVLLIISFMGAIKGRSLPSGFPYAFRSPGTEKTRIPHYLIIDEMSRYINADTEKFLSIAAEYRVAGIFAVQSFSQLEIGAGDLQPRAMKTAILTNCRNKICFGGVTFDDAEYFAKEIRKDWGITRQNTFDGS